MDVIRTPEVESTAGLVTYSPFTSVDPCSGCPKATAHILLLASRCKTQR